MIHPRADLRPGRANISGETGGIKPVIRFPPKNDGDNGADNARKLSVRVARGHRVRWKMRDGSDSRFGNFKFVVL